MKKKLFTACAALCLAAVCLTGNVFAAVGYKGYNYNYRGESVETPEGYHAEQVLYGEQLGTTALNNPQDIFVASDNELYLLDTGNGRVLVLDESLKVKKEISQFIYNDKPLELKEAAGIFVTGEGMIYIADKGNARIVISDQSGRVTRIIGKPRSELIPNDFNYLPVKVAVDRRGMIYVLSENCFQGLITFTPEGKFNGFFGTNRVEVTPAVVFQRMWRRFMTQEQLDAVVQYTPIEYSNFSIDKDGFVYACVKSTKNSTDELKKINASGVNVLGNTNTEAAQGNDYGDLEYNLYRGVKVDTTFVDICADDNGYINALDFERGRIFQYDRDSNLLFVFGNKSSQKGTFTTPVALEVMGDRLIVLDSTKASLTVFRETDFGSKVHTAVDLYNDGKFVESLEPWEQVLKMCANYEQAYRGIGKAQLMLGQQKEAMESFRLADYREGYSDALKDYRGQWMTANFGLIVLLLAVVIVGLVLLATRKRIAAAWAYHKTGVRPAPAPPKQMAYPWRAVFHPFDSFAEMKYRRDFSMKWANIILVVFYLLSIFEKLETGFAFNHVDVRDFNLFSQLGFTLGLFLLFVITNWSFCTLTDGEGRFTEIWRVTAYALIPKVVATIPLTLLSKLLIIEEQDFLSIASAIVTIWCGVMLFMGIKDIHNFSFGKTVGILVLTVIGILAVVFLGVLLFSMFQQLYIFISTIVNELIFRM